MMRVGIILLVIFLGARIAFSQEMFRSIHEVGIKPYKPTMALKEKAAKISGKVIRTEVGEFDSFEDKDF